MTPTARAFLAFCTVWLIGTAWGIIRGALAPSPPQQISTVATEIAHAVIPPAGAAPGASTTEAVATKAVFSQIELEVKSITAEGSALNVDLAAVNRGADRNLTIYRDEYHRCATAYDDQGSGWKAAKLMIGNKSAGRFILARSLLVTGVETPVTLTFTVPTVAGQAQLGRVARLEIPLVVGGSDESLPVYGLPIEPEGLQRVVFRNLVVTGGKL